MDTQFPLVTKGVETVLQPPDKTAQLSSTHATPLFVHVRDAMFVPFTVCIPPKTNAGGTGGVGTVTETFPNKEGRLSKPQLQRCMP